MKTPTHASVCITQRGLSRIPGAKVGDLFLVDHYTESGDGLGHCAHVIEWKGSQRQVWTLGRGDWETPAPGRS